MAAKTQFLTFYICLRDPDLVAQYQAQQWVPAVNLPNNGGIQTSPLPPGLVNRAITPGGADTEFDAPFRGYTQPIDATGNFIYTPWSGAGEEDGPFPLNVATFRRKVGGWWVFGGETVNYFWLGQFVYVPPNTPVNPNTGVPATPANLAEVLWADGFELPDNGEGGLSAAAALNSTPDSSRHLDGLGYSLRHTTAGAQKRHDFDETGAANPAQAWSRVYVRVRRYPDAQGMFWQCLTTTSANGAVTLKLTNSGAIALFAPVSTVQTLVSTSTFSFDLDRWYRLDMLMKCGANPPNDGRFRLFVDGDYENPVFDLNFTTQEGLGGGGVSPVLDAVLVGSSENSNGLEMDFDDWTGHAMPNGTDPTFTGRDWLNGSRVALIRPSSLQSSTNWTGGVRSLWQKIFGEASSAALTSSTSGAVLVVDTDLETEARVVAGALGILAVNVHVRHVRASGTANSVLGYALDGATFVTANKSVSTTEIWQSTLVSLHAGGASPTAIPGPFRVRYVKSADATQLTVRRLGATALLYGAFGPEDVPPYSDLDEENADGLTPVPVPIGIHNTPYPHSPWSTSQSSPPLAPVYFKTGTYTGNATEQDLTFPVPIHFFWVRPLTSPTGAGVSWWSSMLAAHIGLDEGTLQEAVVRAYQNTAFDGVDAEEAVQEQYVISIAGSNSQVNANTVVYQYIAISDPGMRLMMNGAFGHGTVPTSFANALLDSGFTPLLGFFANEDVANTATDRIAWKGPGHAASATQVFSAAEAASMLTFTGAGVMTSGSSLHALHQGNQVAYSVFRRNDGITDANGASQDGKCWQMFSYVGDGAASRTISFPVSVGVRPLWAIIGPTTTTCYQRDPGHTTNTSTNLSTGSVATTTAITAGGIDQITVGSTLNSNGVTYNVFVVMGSATAGNGGWSVDGTFTPVQPDTAPGDQWGQPDFPGDPTDAPEDEEEPDPNDPGELTTDIAANCLSASTRLCNLALSRIGITDQLTSLADDDSVAAAQCQLIYKTEIDATLRAFDWHFATAYSAPLTLVDGALSDPVNDDWTYSYREPSDSVKVRRIVNPDQKRGFDPDPIPFHKSSDANGQLIFTNEPGDKLEADADVVIEYTRRLDCPASRGDAIFRSCAAWRLAAALAIPLGRDEKVAKWALANFASELPVARVTGANEHEAANRGGDPDWISGR